MPSERDKARRWWQLRLWHLVAFVAVIVWAAEHLALAFIYNGRGHSSILVEWDDLKLIDWDSNSLLPSPDPTQPYPSSIP